MWINNISPLLLLLLKKYQNKPIINNKFYRFYGDDCKDLLLWPLIIKTTLAKDHFVSVPRCIFQWLWVHLRKVPSVVLFSGLHCNTVEALQTGTPKNGKPLETERFCLSPEFLSSYLIYPSKLKTPINQTFSLVRRVFGLDGLHCNKSVLSDLLGVRLLFPHSFPPGYFQPKHCSRCLRSPPTTHFGCSHIIHITQKELFHFNLKKA